LYLFWRVELCKIKNGKGRRYRYRLWWRGSRFRLLETVIKITKLCIFAFFKIIEIISKPAI